MLKLENKNAMVTGGSAGIGLGCAKSFAADGANVLIMGRTAERLEKAKDELAAIEGAGDVEVFVGDAGRESDVEAAAQAAARGGVLDIAVANAGMGISAPIMAMESESWDQVMQTNLSGTFYTIKHSARWMAKSGGGAICTISSIAGVRPHRFLGAYCVSKAGIDMLVRNCADELGVAGIRVNSVCPGLVETELASGLFATKEIYNDYLECMPISRHGTVEDISQAVRFLCGPESSWITGVVMSVDGGHHLRRGPNLEPFARAIFGDDLVEGRILD